MPEIISPNDPNFFCSIQSREIKESLLGSAPIAQVWMMLEYEGKWNKKAFDESALPEEIKRKFNKELKAIEKPRLLLIKQSKKEDSKKSFFVALPNQNGSLLLKFSFSNYEELINLDLPDIVKNSDKYKKQLVDEAIILICTNGLRDKCCARNGVPTYQQLNEHYGKQIWQSTHHGSHRFSANMLFMPEALSLGQTDLGNPKEIVDELNNGKISLPHFRGRSSYPKIVQAAEGLLLGEIGSNKWKTLSLLDHKDLGEGDWNIQFHSSSENLDYQLRINREETDKMVFASCVGEKQVPIVHYELISLDVI